MDQGTNSTTFIAEDHLDFLQGLATDESLRAELQAHPVETLAKYGIEMDAATLPSEIKLPEASDVEGALQLGVLSELRTLAWMPFLDDGVEN